MLQSRYKYLRQIHTVQQRTNGHEMQFNAALSWYRGKWSPRLTSLTSLQQNVSRRPLFGCLPSFLDARRTRKLTLCNWGLRQRKVYWNMQFRAYRVCLQRCLSASALLRRLLTVIRPVYSIPKPDWHALLCVLVRRAVLRLVMGGDWS